MNDLNSSTNEETLLHAILHWNRKLVIKFNCPFGQSCVDQMHNLCVIIGKKAFIVIEQANFPQVISVVYFMSLS